MMCLRARWRWLNRRRSSCARKSRAMVRLNTPMAWSEQECSCGNAGTRSVPANGRIVCGRVPLAQHVLVELDVTLGVQLEGEVGVSHFTAASAHALAQRFA